MFSIEFLLAGNPFELFHMHNICPNDQSSKSQFIDEIE